MASRTNSNVSCSIRCRSVSGSQPCLSVRLQTLPRRRGGDPQAAIFHARRLLASRFGVKKATIEAVSNEEGEVDSAISRGQSTALSSISAAAGAAGRVERVKAEARGRHPQPSPRTPGDNVSFGHSSRSSLAHRMRIRILMQNPQTKHWRDIPATSPFMTSAQRSAAATSRGESRAPSPGPGAAGL